MISVEQIFEDRFSALNRRSPIIRNSFLHWMKLLFHEAEFRQFEADHPQLQGLEFVEAVLEYFEFGFTLNPYERERIPKDGPAIIVSNHPIGSLDGLALLQLVSEVRSDVKVVANELLYALKPLRPLLLPVDNMNGNTRRENIQNIETHISSGGALIIFPAGEVSRLGTKGIRDGRWRSGALRFAEKTKAPIVPVHISARNSMLFYAMSLLARPLSTLLLIDEMFRQTNRTVRITIGAAIDYENLASMPLSRDARSALLRSHVYKLPGRRRGERSLQPTAQAIAYPEDRQSLRQALKHCEKLGETSDGKMIFHYRYQGDSPVMREIGRLREVSFRAVGEGTGRRRDIDQYDRWYQHIVLWDDQDLELVGAYRLMPVSGLAQDQDLYCNTLFDFDPSAKQWLPDSVEMGRSFVQPRYWGRRSLDYLWQGLGAWLAKHPEIRYAFGPVSLSNDIPPQARDLIISFYWQWFGAEALKVSGKRPYAPGSASLCFTGEDYRTEFTELKARLAELDCAVPTLYKQYSELCELGGVQFAAFNIDPDFNDCIDGLVRIDLQQLKPAKRQRYIRAVDHSVAA